MRVSPLDRPVQPPFAPRPVHRCPTGGGPRNGTCSAHQSKVPGRRAPAALRDLAARTARISAAVSLSPPSMAGVEGPPRTGEEQNARLTPATAFVNTIDPPHTPPNHHPQPPPPPKCLTTTPSLPSPRRKSPHPQSSVRALSGRHGRDHRRGVRSLVKPSPDPRILLAVSPSWGNPREKGRDDGGWEDG